MKKNSSEIVLLNEFKKTKREILNNLSDILLVSMESIMTSLSTFLIAQPFFIPPLSAILNSFIKGYASFKGFREFEMVVSFIDSAQSKSKTEKSKFAEKIEDDPELIKKLIYYVSQQNDVFKSKLLGHIFSEYLIDELTKEQFISILPIIDKMDWHLILDFSRIVENILQSDDHSPYFYSSHKDKSWECLDLKWSSLTQEHFGKNKHKFLSVGLINEEISVQPIPGVLGNYAEQEQVKRLRNASQNVRVNFNITYEGFLIIRFGSIKNIEEKYSFS
jgi:replicative superfamily II helicase